MKSKMILPAALAVLTAGTGLFTLSRQAEAQEQAAAGPARSLRLEFHSGGPESGTGGDIHLVQQRAQDQEEDPGSMRDFFRELRERQRRGGQRGQANPLDELLKQFGRNESGEHDNEGEADDPDNGDSPVPPRGGAGPGKMNPQDLLEEMLRRMGSGPNGAGRLGFGPNTDKDPPRTSKHHLSAAAEWRPLTAQARQSTVRVMRRDRQIALATIVSADGYALTKASEVSKGGFECEFNDGRIVGAKVVDQLAAYDLALIKLEATGLTPVRFADTATPVGTLIAAVSTDEDPIGLGVISVAARSLDERTKGFLGVQMALESPPKGVRIEKTIDGGAAKRAGMEPGDIILAIDGQEIISPRQLQKLISGLKPEQKVTITIERANKSKSLELSLGHRSEDLIQRQLDQTALMGSSLSQNASGYPNAVQSDLALQAEDAGGPVVDVDGAVVGLNIARAERVSTYLIPGKVVNELLTDVQAGKFSLSKDADTLQAELSEVNASLQKNQDSLKESEARRQGILQSLERLKKK